MDVEQGGLNAAMAGEGRNLVDVPAGARQIGETEMAQGVRTESFDTGAPRNAENDLRPTPDRDGLRVVATRLGKEERPAPLPQGAPMLEVMPCSSSLLETEYGTTRSRRPFVVSARILSVRREGSMSSLRRLHSSSRRKPAS